MNEQKRLTIAALERRLGCSRQTIWRWYRDPAINFPQPHFLGTRRLWWEDEIIEWENARMSARTSKVVGQS